MYEQYLYKQQLLNTFGKDNQLIDNVQLQLRQKIINKLKSTQPTTAPTMEQSLLKKLCNTLFAQYLQNHNYHHSFSVFSPQAHYHKHHFSQEQMKGMFHIEQNQNQSVLQALVRSAMPRGRIVEKRTDSGMQTDDSQSILNLENKLSAVDFSYKQKMLEGLKSVEDSELRFAKYKTELNKRYKKELQDELSRVRNFQIANIRIQEQQKNKVKMRQFQQQLQTNYRAKMQKLRERQAQVIQRVSTKMKQIQSYNYQARQRILKQMQTVHAREQQLQRRKEQLNTRELSLTSK